MTPYSVCSVGCPKDDWYDYLTGYFLGFFGLLFVITLCASTAINERISKQERSIERLEREIEPIKREQIKEEIEELFQDANRQTFADWRRAWRKRLSVWLYRLILIDTRPWE